MMSLLFSFVHLNVGATELVLSTGLEHSDGWICLLAAMGIADVSSGPDV